MKENEKYKGNIKHLEHRRWTIILTSGSPWQGNTSSPWFVILTVRVWEKRLVINSVATSVFLLWPGEHFVPKLGELRGVSGIFQFPVLQLQLTKTCRKPPRNNTLFRLNPVGGVLECGAYQASHWEFISRGPYILYYVCERAIKYN